VRSSNWQLAIGNWQNLIYCSDQRRPFASVQPTFVSFQEAAYWRKHGPLATRILSPGQGAGDIPIRSLIRKLSGGIDVAQYCLDGHIPRQYWLV
jgi:hypothetical protein